jgi:hypothetical protein
MASTNKCLAQSNKSRTRAEATKKREMRARPSARKENRVARRRSHRRRVERVEPYMNSLNPGYSVPLGESPAEGDTPLPIVLCVTCRSKNISSKKRLWQSNAITFVCNDCGTALEQVGDQYKLTHVTDTGSSVWQKYAGKILYRREWANIAQGGYSDEELAIRPGSAPSPSGTRSTSCDARRS